MISKRFACCGLGLVALLMCSLPETFAQQAFQPKTLLLNTGPVFFGQVTDLAISAEYGLSEHLGVGLRATGGYLLSQSVYSGISTSGFVNYHFLRSSHLDPFLGLAVSKTIYNAGREAVASNNYAGGYLLVQGGARYWLTDQLGVYGAGTMPLYRGIMATLEVGASWRIGKGR